MASKLFQTKNYTRNVVLQLFINNSTCNPQTTSKSPKTHSIQYSHEQNVKNLPQKATFVSEMEARRFTYRPENTLLAVDAFGVKNVLECLIDYPPHFIVVIICGSLRCSERLDAFNLRLDVVTLVLLTIDVDPRFTFEANLRLQVRLVVRKEVLALEDVPADYRLRLNLQRNSNPSDELATQSQFSNQNLAQKANLSSNSPDVESDCLGEKLKSASRDAKSNC